MKKVLLISTIMVSIILFPQCSSLADIELSSYFAGYAELENDYGEYKSDWPAAAKVSFLTMIVNHGLTKNEVSATKVLQGNMSESEQDGLASSIIEAYFSEFLIPEARSTFGIMVHELGQIESWAIEDKALYSSLLVKYGRQKEDWPLYGIPSDTDIQENDAVSRAAAKLSQAFGYTEEYLLTSPIIETTFIKDNFYYEDYYKQPVWFIEFRNPNQYDGTFSVILSSHGDILMYKAPGTLPLYGDEDILAEATPAIPSEHDVSEEDVVQHALGSILEISHNTPEDVKALRVEAHFIYHERFCRGREPVWLLYFYKEDEPVYKALFAYNGTYIDIVPYNEEFVNTTRFDFYAASVLGIRFWEIGFWDMSTEERAAFSREWKPVVDEYVESHPYYINHHDQLYYATRNVYGIPQAGDLSQAEAIRIAKEEAIRMGVSLSTMERRQIIALYDVTNVDNPIWKITVQRADIVDILLKMIEENRSQAYANSVLAEYRGRYYIVINARTGEIITSQLFSDEATVGDNIF